MTTNFEMEAKRRQTAEHLAELEALKKTINEKACREAYLANYVESGRWIVPSACHSRKLKKEPLNHIRTQFQEQNPHYKIGGLRNVDTGVSDIHVYLHWNKFQ